MIILAITSAALQILIACIAFLCGVIWERKDWNRLIQEGRIPKPALQRT